MILNSETVFKDIPENASDDQIIDVALMALYKSNMGEGYLFQSQKNRFDEGTVKRVINRMEIKDLVTKYQGMYDTIYTSNYKIEKQGRFIAGGGGWLIYLEKSITELEWLDKILYAAKDGVGEYPERRFALENYEKALQKLYRECLVKARSKYNYELLPNGEKAMELNGYAAWEEYNRKQQDALNNRTNTMTFHGPVTGSIVNQDFLSGSVSNHNLINPQNETAASTPKKADQNTSSLNIWQRIYNWTNHNAISALIVTAIVGSIGLLMKWLGWL
jgi:hypothetical protein